MSSLTFAEKRTLERLFDMGGGYVMNLSNRVFAELFRDTVQVDIDQARYNSKGTSKANRLRTFWETEPDVTVGRILEQMLSQVDEKEPGYDDARNTVARLLGRGVAKAGTEEDFLKINFGQISISKLQIDASLIPILDARLKEANLCLKNHAPFAAVILAGSILEGLLLSCALNKPRDFNQASSAPSKDGKPRPFPEWSLSNFIEVACELGLLGLDVKKFGHSLRDFRNYIHPFQQRASGFHPDEHTAKICLQVLNAAIASLSGER